MNNLELQAARKLLFLDITEAAELIGGASPRAWRFWEIGERSVPDDVSERITELLDIRDEMITSVVAAVEKGEESKVPYAITYDRFKARYPHSDRARWRLVQSVAAEICARGIATLIDEEDADESRGAIRLMDGDGAGSSARARSFLRRPAS